MLGDVHEGVDDAVGDLAGGQGVGLGRIEHREARIEPRVGKGQLVVARAARDDRAVVHLGAGGRQGEDAAKGDRALHRRTLGEDVPRFAGERNRRGDEFGAVDHRTAADGEQEVDVFAARQFDGLHQRLIRRIRLDAAELEERVAGQRGLDLGERTGLDDAAAAVRDQHARAGGNFAREVGNAALAEEDAGRVVEGEVVHRRCLQRAAVRR